MIIKIYRKLFSMFGRNQTMVQLFLNSHNKYFKSKPMDVLKIEVDLKKVDQYLFAMSEKV